MTRTRTLQKEQVEAAARVMERLRVELRPEFLSLVSTSGHLISVAAGSSRSQDDAVASLAASSFAATRQLAQVMEGSEFTVVFHEGNELNVHIAQVSDDVLLVICFHKATQIGKVRLVSGRVLDSLRQALTPADSPAADVILESGGMTDGSD